MPRSSGDAFGSLAGKKQAGPGRNGLTPGIAAGHPATAQAGLEVLVEGGTAADAAVAACLASCVAETVMTGLAGGGHALWWDATERRTELLDFFVAVPGLGGNARTARNSGCGFAFGTESSITRSESLAPLRASAGRPRRLHRRRGRLPWHASQPASPAPDRSRGAAAHAACWHARAQCADARRGLPRGSTLRRAPHRSRPKRQQPGLAALCLVRRRAREHVIGSLGRGSARAHEDRGGPRHGPN